MPEVLTLSKNGHKLGRPSLKNSELLDLICNRIAVGESLRSICADKDIPSIVTVWNWLNEDDGFLKQYTRAREKQADYFADEIIEISNSAKDKDSSAAAKVKMEARMWYAGKTNRSKWSDSPSKTEINLNTQVIVLDPSKQVELQERRKRAEGVLNRETPLTLEQPNTGDRPS